LVPKDRMVKEKRILKCHPRMKQKWKERKSKHWKCQKPAERKHYQNKINKFIICNVGN
jgi:hypothetical protein